MNGKPLEAGGEPKNERPRLSLIVGGRCSSGSAAPDEEIEDLHAWVDQALSPSAAFQVGRRLADAPNEAARVAAYRTQIDGLHALYDPVLDEPIPDHLLAPLRAASQAMSQADAPAAEPPVPETPATETPTPETPLEERISAPQRAGWARGPWLAALACMLGGVLALVSDAMMRLPRMPG